MLCPMKTVLKSIAAIVIIVASGFAGFLCWATISDFQPPPETLVFESEHAPALPGDQAFSFTIWNIGYAGLSKKMDFFYDGGRKVRPQKSTVESNVAAITAYLSGLAQQDFILLQEVDQASKRSWFINEYEKIVEALPGHHASFAKNYDVGFVPLPVTDPMGKVLSGLQTLSRGEPFSVVRHSFPGNYSWPQGLFMLDRCFMASGYHLEGSDKKLVVINTHNSAYDDGRLRSRQMAYLEDFLLKEHQKGNYVVVGGDWNQCPPGFEPAFARNRMDNKDRMDIEKSFLPEWQWVYDKTVPTNRRVNIPYDEAGSLTTMIDFFLVSPNIEVKSVKGIHLGFEHSDHQPVQLEIVLKPE